MGQGNAATPFLEMRSFVREDSEVFASEGPTAALASPFVSVYEMEGQTALVDPEQEALSLFAQDLYDEEFEEALFELLTEARGLHEEHLTSNPQGVDGERLLRQHFNQLIREAEAAVGAFEREFGARDAETITEGEVDAFVARLTPPATLEPEFEEFFGKLVKKIGGVVKKAASVVKKVGGFAMKLGLGPVLKKLGELVKPMLNKVLEMAIGRLPEPVRPAARLLAQRLFRRRERPPTPADDAASADAAAAPPEDPSAAVDASATSIADAAPPAQLPVAPDVTDVQQELDHQIASLLFASDEVEMELEVARARDAGARPASSPYTDLEEARERFISQLQELEEGEDPTPHIQNFLPAVIPIVKLGMKFIGRERVVGFLANLLAKLIGKLIGPQAAPALSRAIVNTGLKMLSLEVSPQDEARAGAAAVAATVEETMRRVVALPEYVLNDQELLEGFALEAFEQAAAANLPPILSDAAYRERPDLREAHGANTTWVMLPLRSRKRFKKCGRIFKVRITPWMAEELETFEGPLSEYLQDQLGIEEGAEVEAEVHLYETLPGTTIPDIAREESEAVGSRLSRAAGAAHFHPLTSKAAGLLLGEPRMGRQVPLGTTPRRVADGLRLYRLAIPGKRLLMAPGPDGRPRPRKSGKLRIVLDCARDEIRLSVFLSEVRAQRLAVRLRRKLHNGTMAAGFRKFLAARLGGTLRGERPNRIRIIQAGLGAADAFGLALRRLPMDVSGALTTRVLEAAVTAFAALVRNEAQRVIGATEDTADGITLTFTISRFAGLQQIGKALIPGGRASGLAETILRGARAEVRVDVNPGDRHV